MSLDGHGNRLFREAYIPQWGRLIFTRDGVALGEMEYDGGPIHISEVPGPARDALIENQRLTFNVREIKARGDATPGGMVDWLSAAMPIRTGPQCVALSDSMGRRLAKVYIKKARINLDGGVEIDAVASASHLEFNLLTHLNHMDCPAHKNTKPYGRRKPYRPAWPKRRKQRNRRIGPHKEEQR